MKLRLWLLVPFALWRERRRERKRQNRLIAETMALSWVGSVYARYASDEAADKALEYVIDKWHCREHWDPEGYAEAHGWPPKVPVPE